MNETYVYNAKNADGSQTYSGPVSGMPQGYTVPSTPPVNSIPADQLGTNPKAYSTYFPAPTAAAGLTESALASKDTYFANLAKEADAAKATEGQQLTQAKSLFDRLGLSSTSKVNAEEAAGLNTQKQELDSITSEMERVGRSFDKQIETLQTNNPGGELASGVSNDVNRLQREKASTLADLAIVLNAKTRNYDTAKSIVDAKADAETEDLKTQLQGLQFFYQQNEGNLSDAKRALLQDKIDAANKEYQDARQLRSDVGQVQLAAAKNNAPISVVRAIGQAKTLDDAMAAATGYLKDNSVDGVFTQTQANGGATNAGLSIADFNTLPVDDKNYFINGYGNFQSALKQVQSGTATQDDLKAAIDNAPLSDRAKQILYTQGGIDTSGKKSGGGFFSGAWDFVSNLFSS